MPFKHVGKNDNVSPSGRHFNDAQVRLWHAQGGKFPGQKHSESGMSKFNSKPQAASYAAGGPVLGRVRDFMKEPDEFRNPDERNAAADEDQNYAKSGAGKGDGVKKLPKNTPKVLKRGK